MEHELNLAWGRTIRVESRRRGRSRVLVPPIVTVVAACCLPYASAAQSVLRLGYEAEQVLPAAVLGSPRIITVDPDGNLVATFPDADSGRVVMVDGESDQARSIPTGGIGAGAFPFRVGWVADTIWATDIGSTVMVLFDSAWHRLAERPLVLPTEGGLTRLSSVLALASSGKVLIDTTVPIRWMWPGTLPQWTRQAGIAARPAETVVARHPILLASGTRGTPPDTVAWLSTRNRALVMAAGEIRPSRASLVEAIQPFGDFPLFAWHTALERLALVDRSIAAGTEPPVYSIHMVSFTGDTLRRNEFAYDPIPLSDAAFRAVALGRAEPLSDDSTEALAIARTALYRPPWLPPVTGILMGPHGWIWVRREAVPGATTVQWDIIDPRGRRVGAIDITASLDVRAVHGLEGWALQDRSDDGAALWRVQVHDGPAVPAGGDPGERVRTRGGRN